MGLASHSHRANGPRTALDDAAAVGDGTELQLRQPCKPENTTRDHIEDRAILADDPPH